MTEQRRGTAADYLRQINEEYRKLASGFYRVARDAAEAEAEHKAQRAIFIIGLKDEKPGMSHAEAVTRAEADVRIRGLYRDRLLKAGVADSYKEKLRQLKEEVPSARTDVVNERGADEFHARGYSGVA
ncbi:MAG: hypothetical protein JWO67_4502 [Streptosporangiaceae bacterium]|nr:hypothetical protein [Streptosporangiaceae bacterium]